MEFRNTVTVDSKELTAKTGTHYLALEFSITGVIYPIPQTIPGTQKTDFAKIYVTDSTGEKFIAISDTISISYNFTEGTWTFNSFGNVFGPIPNDRTGFRLYYNDLPSIDLNKPSASASINTVISTTPPQESAFTTSYLSETFDDNSNFWQLGNIKGSLWTGTRSIENGVLEWDGTSHDSLVDDIYPRKKPFQNDLSDAQISVRVNPVNRYMNGAYGLVIKKQDEENFYTYVVDNNGYFGFFLLLDNEWKYLIDWKENPYLKRGTWNSMMVQITGNHYKLFFNDNLLAEIDDDTFTSGKIGLLIEVFEDKEKIQIQMDDFEVSLPPP